MAAASDDRAAQGLSRRRQLSVVASRLVEQLERQPLLRLGEQLGPPLRKLGVEVGECRERRVRRAEDAPVNV